MSARVRINGNPEVTNREIAPREVLCVGEVLWDSLPTGLFLGGAPFNVAAHLHALGVPVGLLSRVGSDSLATDALQRLTQYGISTDLIQIDKTLPTGFVSVTLDPAGVPEYDIVRPAAWDAIELLPGVIERAEKAGAIVLGSLAQRSSVTRRTIQRLCEVDVPKVFDVNLRWPYHDKAIVEESLLRADIVKLNDYELGEMSTWFDLPREPEAATNALAQRFGCATVCVTRGADGAALLHEGLWSEHSGFRVVVKDTVGSGDAFLAAFLSWLLAGSDAETVLRNANLFGAYVATQEGAIPRYQQEELDHILAVNEESTRREVAFMGDAGERH